LNTFKAFIADLWPIAPYIGQWVLNGCGDIRDLLARLKAQPSRGDVGSAWAHVSWKLFLLLLRYPVQFVLTISALIANAVISLINNVFNLSRERRLNQEELLYLQPIFGNNLDYRQIKIQTGGIKERFGISPQAVGVDIFLRKVWGSPIVVDDQSLTPAGLRLLGHEACHVWQFQHRGAGYVGDSLITQLFDVVGRKLGVRLSDGYDVQPALYAKLQFDECNIEQQAVIAELIGVLCNDRMRTSTTGPHVKRLTS